MKIVKLLKFLSNNLDISEFLKNNSDFTSEEIKNFFKDLLKDYSISKYELYIDGASKGNPGEAGAGFIICKNGEKIVEKSIYLGKKTNNEAEYLALIYGLKKIKELGISELKIFSDSQLLVNQIKGEYRVKNSRLKELYYKVKELLNNINYEIQHIPRENNKIADKLANIAIELKKGGNLDEN